jgi:hypothetical protein
MKGNSRYKYIKCYFKLFANIIDHNLCLEIVEALSV